MRGCGQVERQGAEPGGSRRPRSERGAAGTTSRRAAAALALVAAACVLTGLPLAPKAASAQAQASASAEPAGPAATPRPLPPPRKVTITPTGFEPLDVAVVAGQTVEFTNLSGAEQTVNDPGTLFDSGPIPDGGGFSVTIPVPGYNDYNSANRPEWIGSITVGQLELPGPPAGLVNQNLTEVTVPPAMDLDEIPDLGIGASRTRIVVRFRDTATVAQANAALAAADVKVLGTTPAMHMVVVAVDDPGVGQFDPVTAASDVLRADPAVQAAGLDLERTPEVAPPTAESARVQGPDTSPTNWTWTDARFPNGSGLGTGGNYGSESARFPQAWNLLDDIAKKNNVIDTVVLDTEFFQSHLDLKDNLTVKPLCNAAGRCARDVAPGPNGAHATHVSGIIGATYANPLPSQPGHVLGVDGANRAVHLYGTPVGSFLGNVIPRMPPPVQVNRPGWAFSTITEEYGYLIQGKAGNLWPNLRVVNFSLGSFSYKKDPDGRAKWGRVIGARRCGPGSNDDKTPAATGPCTPQTEDRVRQATETAAEFAKDLAFLARQSEVTLVWAAGNESSDVCIKPDNGVSQPPCTGAQTVARPDARLILDAGLASAQMGDTDLNPFVLVEAVDSARARSSFSNLNGDVSAAGTQVLSTVAGNLYAAYDGTSMATPHVTALVGYLLAYKPDLTYTQIRRLLKEFGWNDVTDGASPRIDAFNTLLAADAGAAKALVDVNDHSADGNRRINHRLGGDRVDDLLGPPDGGALRSDPDGRVDMRDFRRFRDAFLEACDAAPTSELPSPSLCPQQSAIRLDGDFDHPKKDLNFDGCVAWQTEACTQPEYRFSRFDFNGDGTLDLAHAAPLPLVRDPAGGTRPAASRAQGEQFTDLGLLQAWWDADLDRTEGYRASDLGNLLTSGDLEVHADALFQAGATSVAVTVNGPSASIPTPPQRINAQGASVVVTAPADGSEVKISGVGFDKDGKAIVAYPEVRTLLAGDDHRVDLCTPTVSAVPSTTKPYTDAGSIPVNVTVKNCGRSVEEPIELLHIVDPRPGGPAPASTLSAPTSRTNAAGRGGFRLNVAPRAESFDIVVKAQIDLDPAKPGLEEVTGRVGVDVTDGPRLVYKWEQVTDQWSMHQHSYYTDVNLQRQTDDSDWGPPTTDPLVLQRQGTVTPVAEGPDGRSDARIVEDVGPNAVPYTAHHVTSDGQAFTDAGTWAIPESQRHRDQLASQTVVDRYVEGGPEIVGSQETLGNTYFDTDGDQVVIHNLEDVGGLRYKYSLDPGPACGVFCRELWDLDQISLGERERGSSLRWTDDLSNNLVFHRGQDDRFGTYTWCSQPEQLAMRNAVQGIAGDPSSYTWSGTARSRYRFTATLTTDPDLKPEDLEFPPDCVTPEPPIAAIARDFVDAKEGDLVKFLDASSDPNGDVAEWHWDFGDGKTSDEQFPRHRFDDDGSYRVQLTVKDSKGAQSTATLDVDIGNAVPEVNGDPVRVPPGEAALVPVRLFDAGERDQEALTLKISWQEGGSTYADVTTKGGDATLNLGVQPPGLRHLRVTVTDKDGGSASTVIDVDVGATPAPAEPLPEVETAAAPGCVYGVRLNVDEQDFLDQVTSYRVRNGRRELYASPTLTAAAEVQARWLRDQDLFQHEGEGGNSPWDRVQAAGYPGTAAAENLARGPEGAPGALVVWKISNPHDAAQLDPRWRAVGIARVDTIHGPLWAAVYGDRLDCPTEPPDFEGAEVDPIIEPGGRPTPVVLASGAGDGVEPAAAGDTPSAVPTPSPVITLVPPPAAGPAPTDGPAATDAAAPPAADDPVVPVVAFTTSVVAPGTGDPVTVTNRSPGPAALTPGDGRPPVSIDPGAATTLTYLVPGTFTLRATAGGTAATHDVVVGGPARPPVLAYTGPTAGAQGARVDLRAAVKTAAGTAVVGRVVDFTVEGRHVAGTSDATGEAVASLVIDLAGGAHTLHVEVAATDSGAGASLDVQFTVAPNTPPVVDAHGPYDVVLGQPLDLDLTGSFDPDGLPLGVSTWDLDDDGQFDDFTGAGVVAAGVVTSTICGGTCTPGTDETIRVRVLDVLGGETVVTTTVRFRRDFSLAVEPPYALVNPGGNVGYHVVVSTDSGFDQPVTLSVPDLPTGVTATFTPATVVPYGTSLLALRVDPAAPAFDGNFTVRATSGSLTHDATGRVEVEFGLVPLCTADADVRVVDGTTGLPLAGAYVGFTQADADGRVHFTGLALGPGNSPASYRYVGSQTGYAPNEVTAVAACGVDIDAVIPLFPRVYGTVTGRFVEGVPDPDDHGQGRRIIPTTTPIAQVNAVGFGPTPSSTTYRQTNADGTFSYPDVNPGYPYLSYSAAGYWPEEDRNAVVPANGTLDVTPALVRKCTAEIDVRVLDSATRLPLTGVSVYATGREGVAANGTTGTGGRVRLTGVPLGPRNSSFLSAVNATATIGGRTVSDGRLVNVVDCGTVSVVDLTLRTPVARTGAVKGRVTNATTGEPVAGAPVYVNGYGLLTTDGDGRYQTPPFVFAYDGPGYLDIAVTVQPPPAELDRWTGSRIVGVRMVDGQTVTLDTTLAPQLYSSVDIRVVDADTGEPVAGAETSEGPVTDGDGRARIEGIRANTPFAYNMWGWAPGYVKTTASTTLVVGGNAELIIRIPRECSPATIRGSVRNAATGAPLEGARVGHNSDSQPNPDPNPVLTDQDGRFTLTRVAVRERRPTVVGVGASKAGFISAGRSVTLYCGASLTIDIGVPNTGAGSLSGTITRADTGAVVPGAVVTGEWGQTAIADGAGRYSFSSVPLDGAVGQRSWGVRVEPPVGPGLGPAQRPVTIVADQAATLDVALPGPLPNGRPVADPQVFTVPDGQRDITATMTGSDPDGDPLIFRAVTRNSAKLGVNYSFGERTVILSLPFTESEGRFTFVATDGRLDSVPADIIVRRGPPPPNTPPTAVIAPLADVDEGATVAFDGSGSTDPDVGGSVVGYAWDLDGDGAYDDSTSATPSRAYPDDATVTIGLEVTDDDGAKATTSRVLRVRNVAPAVTVGNPVTIGIDGHLTRSGSFGDPGADTWTATADFGDGASGPLGLTGKTFTLDHTYAAAGSYTASVRVCDDEGACGTGSLAVTVPRPANQPPTARIDAPATVAEGSTVTFDASGSTDPDGPVVAWDWDLDGDGSFDDATGATTAAAAPDDGVVTATVRVRDADGATATDSRSVTVTNVAPGVDAGPDEAVLVGEALARRGSFADPGADTWTGTVDWGDGGPVAPLPITGRSFDLDHLYPSAGNHTVTVRVCDDDAGCGTDTFSVDVSEPPPPPSADVSVEKSHDADLVAGGTVDYVLAVTNAGPDPAAMLTVTDTLPAGLTFVSGAGTGWSCAAAGQVVTCSRSQLTAVGAAPVLTVRARLAASLSAGATVTNAASVASTTDDPDDTDNTDVDGGVVVAATSSADLSVTLTGPGSVTAGQTATWTATVTNDGPDDAGVVSVSVLVPAGIADAVVAGDGWSCAAATPVVCTRASLAAGASVPLTISGRATAAAPGGAPAPPAATGNLEATVTGGAPDPDEGDNHVSLAVTVLPAQTSSSSTSSSTSTSTSTSTSISRLPSSTPSSARPSTTGSTGRATTTSTAPAFASPIVSSPSTAAATTAAASAAASAGSSVRASTTGSLPATGSSTWPLLVGALALLASGSVLLRVRRRLQRSHGVARGG